MEESNTGALIRPLSLGTAVGDPPQNCVTECLDHVSTMEKAMEEIGELIVRINKALVSFRFSPHSTT